MLKTAPPLGAGYMTALDELIMFQILEELDPLVRDLLSFCEKPGAADEQRCELR